MDINKNSYKVLKYINNHSGSVPYQAIFTKFSKHVNPTIDDSVRWLIGQKLIWVNYSGRDSSGGLIDPDRIHSTIEGKSALEERSSRNNSDLFARTTSIVAILLSLASIVISVVLSK